MHPRKIQGLTIPLIMDGLQLLGLSDWTLKVLGHDIKGHAETGSGKSAAFLLPIINQLMTKKKNKEYESKRGCPYAVIIEPTRELVYQLYDQARKLADGLFLQKYLPNEFPQQNCPGTGITVSKCYGKFQRKANIREISVNGCDILIGTPGRLWDFFQSDYVSSSNRTWRRP